MSVYFLFGRICAENFANICFYNLVVFLQNLMIISIISLQFYL